MKYFNEKNGDDSRRDIFILGTKKIPERERKALLSDADIENLRHMLGIGSHIKKRQWGYRNHFVPGGADIQSMERLELAGLVRKGRPYEDTHYYHATEDGCAAAELKPYQIRKAMES